jgi:hypothetical protein
LRIRVVLASEDEYRLQFAEGGEAEMFAQLYARGTSYKVSAMILVVAVSALLTVVVFGPTSLRTPHDSPAAVRNAERLPLAFEPNVGQFSASVAFLSHASRGGTLYFTADEVMLPLEDTAAGQDLAASVTGITYRGT